MDIKQVKKLTKLTEKKVELLKELQESLVIKTMKYHYIKHSNFEHSIVNLKTNKIICHGELSRLRSYINLRRMNISTIYKWPERPKK